MNDYLTTYYKLSDAKRDQQNATTRLLRVLHDLGDYDDDLIEGLCPNQDSCEQCRKARMVDPGRQVWLMKKWRLEAIRSSGAVQSDLRYRMQLTDEGWIEFYTNWANKTKSSLADYYEWIKGVDVPVHVQVTFDTQAVGTN